MILFMWVSLIWRQAVGYGTFDYRPAKAGARDVFIPAGNQRSTIFWQLLVALVFCRPDAFVGRWIFFSLLVPVR